MSGTATGRMASDGHMRARGSRYGWAFGVIAGIYAGCLFVWEFVLLVLRINTPNLFVNAWLVTLAVSVVLLVYAILKVERTPLTASLVAGLVWALAIGPVVWALLFDPLAFRGLFFIADAWWVIPAVGVPPLIVAALGTLKWRADRERGTRDRSE